jgi:tetratricopeptide (TPR) repeat protein
LFNTVRPVFRRALPIAENLLETANAADSRDFRLVAQSALIRCACWMGRFEAVDRAYAELDELYDPSRLKQLMELTGEDSYMAAASFTALAWIARGQPEAGLAILERLAKAQERTSIPGVVEGTWAQLAFGYLLCGMDDPNSDELRLAREYGQRARESAMRLGFPFWAGYGGLMEASAGVYQGDLAAVDAVDGAMQMFIAAGATIGFGWNYSTLAFGLLQRGQLDEAARALQAARQHVADSDERFFVAEQTRIEARLLLARNPADTRAVEAKLREAIALGQSQGANLFVARAKADLAAIGRS